MNAVGAVVSDCRGTAAIDREAVADDLDAEATVTTAGIADHRQGIRKRLPLEELRQVVVVAGEGPARERLVGDLRARDIATATINPYLGDANRERADAIVAGAANAAIATLPARADFSTGSVPANESIVVVGDAAAAAELADVAAVTLVANGAEFSTTALPEGVNLVAGRAGGIERRSDGYAVRVARRVTDGCTGCGRCMRKYPDDTTDVPVDVVTDRAVEDVCPVDAIRPADDPVVEELAADQVVWPGYEGDPADTKWVHTDAVAVAAAVRRAARLREHPSVSVDPSACAAGTRGHDGCSACREACPNDAISISTAGEGSVTINGDRCIGCGTCVSVCPTAAIDPVRTFDLDAFADAVGAAVEPFDDGSGSLLGFGEDDPFAVAFVDEDLGLQFDRAASTRPVPAVVPIQVPNALHVPDVAVLYAIALGADGALLAADPTKDLDPVRETADDARDVLAAFDLDAPVAVAESRSPADLADAMAEAVPAARVPGGLSEPVSAGSRLEMGQRVAAGFADDTEPGRVEVPVPGGGDVAVDAEACTLCETCGNLCPTDALTQDAGELRFDPSACVGCGICEAACPEDAIEVSETAPVDGTGVGDERVAVEKELVECSVCGEPFASRDGLDAIREQLDDDALDAIDLEVCPSCRQKSSPGGDVRLPR